MGKWGEVMTEYEKLVMVERVAHTVEIVERLTGKVGVAQTFGEGVSVFYGEDDGSDDKIVSPQIFNRDFRITLAVLA